MSAVNQLTEALIAAGMTPGEAAGLLARAHAEMAVPTRSKGAARTARWREKKASQSVTERHDVTPENGDLKPSPTVTERHKASHGDDAHISILSSSESQEESPKEVRQVEAKQRRKASRLSPDWQPSEANIAFAIERGIANDRLPTVIEKFRNHWTSKSGAGATKLDWDATWRTWCINEIDWNGAQNGQRFGDHRAASASGSQQSSTSAILAGVAAAASRRARERGSGQLPPEGTTPGLPEPKLI